MSNHHGNDNNKKRNVNCILDNNLLPLNSDNNGNAKKQRIMLLEKSPNHEDQKPQNHDEIEQKNNETFSFRIVPDSASSTKLDQSSEHEMASQHYPQIGKPAPAFEGTAVVNGQFKEISLSQYKGKYVIIFFYPMDFTFVCPTEIIAFSDRVDEFKKLNCEVIAASTDSHYTHLAWINTPRKQGGLGQMNIPLLADKNGKISRDYGVLMDLGIPLRGLFIIDGNGILRQITINDLPVGRNVDETLRLVQAFQYTDVHGEVCPANWKPGEDTIKPGVDSSKEYFSKKN